MKATFVSVWDGNNEVRSSCEIDLNTNDVTLIECVDVDDMDLDILFEQFVELPSGEKIHKFTIEGEEVE